MLGCQDFCGYYDWTFEYLQRTFGAPALREYWSQAIGADAQRHYEVAAHERGLAGLLATWNRTGEDEHCDWTFQLDEARNTLRWDMRKCPSKGFLLTGDLNKSEDYCDHCMGWIIPMLARAGAEVIGHEHNHCGQCWGEIAIQGRPHAPLEVAQDIRKSPEWRRGFIDGWKHGRKLPVLDVVSRSADPCEVLRSWFDGAQEFIAVDVPSPTVTTSAAAPDATYLFTDEAYLAAASLPAARCGVLIGHPPNQLAELGRRFLATSRGSRPLLMHLYLPGIEQVDFVTHGLPRPVPILPWLIRHKGYVHTPGVPCPTTADFVRMLVRSLTRQIVRYWSWDSTPKRPSG